MYRIVNVKSFALFILAFVLSTNVNAALVGRLAATEGGTDYQAYYDDVADLTWLADANYAVTSGYATANATGSAHSSTTNIQTDGSMGWEAANTWAASLNIGGVTGWRMYDHGPYCQYYDCTGSEIGNLFYNVLGGSAGNSIIDVHNSNFDLFSNIQSGYYWSNTAFTGDDAHAWHFHMNDGSQDPYYKIRSMFAWAVHSGDVGLAPVPVPATVWLFCSGLVGLIGIARRRNTKL